MSAHVADRLSAFLDAALEPAEQREVSAHLDACAECQRALEDLHALDELAHGLPRELEPEDHALDLVAGFRAQLKRPRRTRSGPWWLAAAAATAFIAFVPWLLVRRNPQAAYSVPAPAPADEQAPAVKPVAPPASADTAARDVRRLAKPGAKDDGAATAVAPTGGLRQEQEKQQQEKKSEAFERAGRDEGAMTRADKEFAAPPPADGSARSNYSQAAPPRTQPELAEALDDSEGTSRHAAEAAKPAPAQEPQAAAGAANGAKAGAGPGAGGYAVGGVGEGEREADSAVGKRVRREPSFASGQEARRARDRWTELAGRTATESDAEDARLAAIEAAAAAYRLDGREKDLARLRSMVREYLARAEAPSAEYVQGLLNGALAEKTP